MWNGFLCNIHTRRFIFVYSFAIFLYGSHVIMVVNHLIWMILIVFIGDVIPNRPICNGYLCVYIYKYQIYTYLMYVYSVWTVSDLCTYLTVFKSTKKRVIKTQAT